MGSTRRGADLAAKDGAAPGETRSEGRHGDDLTRLQAPLLGRFGQEHGDRSRRAVSVALDIVEHPTFLDLHLLCDEFVDSQIGLMEEE